MNHFQWDLKYSPAYDYPGFKSVPTDDWADTADGPTIVPGSYRVVLQYGSQRLQAPLTVQLDPRIHPARRRLGSAPRAGDADILCDRPARPGNRSAIELRQRCRIGKANANRREVANLTLTGVMLERVRRLASNENPRAARVPLELTGSSYARPTAAEYAAAKDLEELASAGETRLEALATK